MVRRRETSFGTGLAAAVLLGVFCGISRGEARGPYPVGWMDVQVPGPSGSFPATVYYPAREEGAATPLVESTERFPALSFAHGWRLPVESYASSLAQLASHGYVIVATRSQMDFLPLTEEYADDLDATITYLLTENQRNGSHFHQRIQSDALGLLGHSQGAGACIIAAAQNQRVKALVVWAPANPSGSLVQDSAAKLQIPVQIVTGSDDLATPFLFEVLPVAAAMPPPGQLLMMWGGTHWGFLDREAQVYFSRTAALGEAQLILARETALAFFDVHLRHDHSQWGQVWGPIQFFRPGVLVYLNPGLRMAPYSMVTPVVPGGTAVFDVQLVSSSPRTTAYDVVVYTESGAVTVSPQTVSLDPGESKWVEVKVAVPAEQPVGDITVVLTARSELDRATRAYAFAFARVSAR